MFLDRSRSTSCKAGHDGAASSGASKSFSTHAENRFSVARFHVLRSGQTVPAVALGLGNGGEAEVAASGVQEGGGGGGGAGAAESGEGAGREAGAGLHVEAF